MRPRRKPVRELTQDEENEIKEAFALFDSDRSGTINYRELKTCLRALGFPVKKAEVKELLRPYEKPGCLGQAIDFEEFRALMRDKYLERNFDDLAERAFDIFDIERSGKIRLKGLKAVAREVGEEIPEAELQDMIDMFDRDGDGCIDLAEFKRVLQVYDPCDHDDDE